MTARRTLTLDDGESGLRVSVWFDRWDLDRAQFGYSIGAGDTVFAEGTDLRMGSGANPVEARALETLLSFLSAFAEAVEHESRTGSASDNGTMFPESLRDAAETIGSDGFYMLAESVRGELDE